MKFCILQYSEKHNFSGHSLCSLVQLLCSPHPPLTLPSLSPALTLLYVSSSPHQADRVTILLLATLFHLVIGCANLGKPNIVYYYLYQSSELELCFKDLWPITQQIVWLEGLTANAKVATFLGSIPASSDTVKSEWRQMKQGWIKLSNSTNDFTLECSSTVHVTCIVKVGINFEWLSQLFERYMN